MFVERGHRLEGASAAASVSAGAANAFEHSGVAFGDCGGAPSDLAGGGWRRPRDVHRDRRAGGRERAAGARVPPHARDARAAADRRRHAAAFWDADANGASASL